LSSPERRRAFTVYGVSAILSYGLGFAAWFVISQSEDLDLSYRGKVDLAALLIAGGLALVVGAFMYVQSARGRYEQRLAKAEAEEALERLTSAMKLRDLLHINPQADPGIRRPRARTGGEFVQNRPNRDRRWFARTCRRFDRRDRGAG
jgi:hypothetical protein